MKITMFILTAAAAVFAAGQNATVPGVVTAPYPTVSNIGIEWPISGDDNLNGTVTVQFRLKGDSPWRQAMPLRRVPAGENLGFSWKNKHAGSVFDLLPGKQYEIKCSLSDPDGGEAETTVTVATRPVPVISSNAKVTTIAAGVYDVLSPENGTEAEPRVYYSPDGAARYDFVDLQNRQWVVIWGLTITSSGDNSARAVKMNGAKHCSVRYCTISGLYGITAVEKGITDCYIADNIVTGTNAWTEAAMGANGDNEGEGIQFTGPGNVVCHNRVKGFRDCISTMEDEEADEQIGIDIYNNDIYVGADDAVEADFCMGNCRIMRNRITNSYVGLSSQPGLGGPTYFIRNVMYNVVHGAFKLKRDSRGDVCLHNTVIKIGAGLAGNDAMDFACFRNNLAVGGPNGNVNWGGYGAGNPYAADIRDPGSHSSFDYDAVGVEGVDYVAKIGGEAFDKVEPHGVGRITLSGVFGSIVFPNPPVPQRAVPDLRPLAGSAVVDKGILIPNNNDGFGGEAPDCGAYEAGQNLPIYGPRPPGVDEGTGATVTPTGRPFGSLPRDASLHYDQYKRRIVYRGPLALATPLMMKVYSISGRMVKSFNASVCSQGDCFRWFDAGMLPPGFYMAHIQAGAGQSVSGLVISR